MMFGIRLHSKVLSAADRVHFLPFRLEAGFSGKKSGESLLQTGVHPYFPETGGVSAALGAQELCGSSSRMCTFSIPPQIT